MIVQANNGRKFDETGLFHKQMLNFTANFAPLLTNKCQSLVSDINIGLIRVV
jgi:hypothetical protein